MLGTIAKGKIIDENDNAYYVQIDGVTYELKKQELTQDEIPKVGDEIEGFIYDNKSHDREMTQFLPFAQPDQYGWGKVTEVRPGLGVFVDVGLPDKDVVISMDDLPREKERWPRRDDRILVRLETDYKDRIWAKLAEENIFDQLAANFPNGMNNENVFGTVYATREIGAFVLTNDYYLGFVHESQIPRPMRLGEQFKGRVIGISQYGRLNLSALPRAFEEIDDDAQMILMSLRRRETKTLPFYDKSDAQEIKRYFGISKSAFKRALGHLLKAGLIEEDKTAGTITLIKDPEENTDGEE
ncbi:Conserved virulence factor B [Lactobacillus helveticus]|uniref:Conserved virulence factor B n=1 Tax=Lactobacillus helveticus TaxID=1587 RepID=A0A9Q5G6D9_LACHE|nr:S1-like domain-containing RNA-binding protein [Lactobacillus helveticus]NRN78895.1 Conserved virulence factor B [Lactobacillus helveticus]NRN91667.1 Conserved virulence factor B [Lactobacillus helveticus]NRN96186.1 Conserved virulence factor B [Lactobacillus helveticus]NRO14610.1 Conserved virulence factor B [Lactobacillus helveticus]NRO52618.1 Conserved virulence factor B [Lactobacillus helveticus]